MPSKSKAQHRLMEAVAHNTEFAKKVGIPKRVGEEFTKADKMVGRLPEKAQKTSKKAKKAPKKKGKK